MTDRPSERNHLLRTTLLFVLSFATWSAGPELRSQPVNPAPLTTPGFQQTDLDPYFNAANQAQSLSGWEFVVAQGKFTLSAQWEATVDAQIDAQVLAANQSDSFNTATEYKDYLRKVLTIERQKQYNAWELAADAAIMAERQAYYEAKGAENQKEGESEADAALDQGGNLLAAALAGDGNSLTDAGTALKVAEADWNSAIKDDVNAVHQQYFLAAQALQQEYANFDQQLIDQDNIFQQNLATIKAYETAVRNALTNSVAQLKSNLNSQSLFYADGCGPAGTGAACNTLNTHGVSVSNLVTSLETGLAGGTPVSALAVQMNTFLQARRGDVITTRNTAFSQIDNPVNNWNQDVAHPPGGARSDDLVGGIADYIDNNASVSRLQNAIKTRYGLSANASDITINSANVCGWSPASNYHPYVITAGQARTAQCYSPDTHYGNGVAVGHSGNSAFTYEAANCIGALGVGICIPDFAIPEERLLTRVSFTWKNVGAETTYNQYTGYLNDLNTIIADWDNLVPALQNWEAQVARYEADYAAFQADAAAKRLQAQQTLTGSVDSLVNVRNQQLAKLDQQARKGRDEWAGIRKQFQSERERIRAEVAALDGLTDQERINEIIAREKIAARQATTRLSDRDRSQADFSSIINDARSSLKLDPGIKNRATQNAIAQADLDKFGNIVKKFNKSFQGTYNLAFAETLKDKARDSKQGVIRQIKAYLEKQRGAIDQMRNMPQHLRDLGERLGMLSKELDRRKKANRINETQIETEAKKESHSSSVENTANDALGDLKELSDTDLLAEFFRVQKKRSTEMETDLAERTARLNAAAAAGEDVDGFEVDLDEATGDITVTRRISSGRAIHASDHGLEDKDYIREEEVQTFTIKATKGDVALADTGKLTDAWDYNEIYKQINKNINSFATDAFTSMGHYLGQANQAASEKELAFKKDRYSQKREANRRKTFIESVGQAVLMGGANLGAAVQSAGRDVIADRAEEFMGIPAGLVSGLLAGKEPMEALGEYAENKAYSDLEQHMPGLGSLMRDYVNRARANQRKHRNARFELKDIVTPGGIMSKMWRIMDDHKFGRALKSTYDTTLQYAGLPSIDSIEDVAKGEISIEEFREQHQDRLRGLTKLTPKKIIDDVLTPIKNIGLLFDDSRERSADEIAGMQRMSPFIAEKLGLPKAFVSSLLVNKTSVEDAAFAGAFEVLEDQTGIPGIGSVARDYVQRALDNRRKHRDHNFTKGSILQISEKMWASMRHHAYGRSIQHTFNRIVPLETAINYARGRASGAEFNEAFNGWITGWQKTSVKSLLKEVFIDPASGLFNNQRERSADEINGLRQMSPWIAQQFDLPEDFVEALLINRQNPEDAALEAFKGKFFRDLGEEWNIDPDMIRQYVDSRIANRRRHRAARVRIPEDLSGATFLWRNAEHNRDIATFVKLAEVAGMVVLNTVGNAAPGVGTAAWAAYQAAKASYMGTVDSRAGNRTDQFKNMLAAGAGAGLTAALNLVDGGVTGVSISSGYDSENGFSFGFGYSGGVGSVPGLTAGGHFQVSQNGGFQGGGASIGVDLDGDEAQDSLGFKLGANIASDGSFAGGNFGFDFNSYEGGYTAGFNFNAAGSIQSGTIAANQTWGSGNFDAGITFTPDGGYGGHLSVGQDFGNIHGSDLSGNLSVTVNQHGGVDASAGIDGDFEGGTFVANINQDGGVSGTASYEYGGGESAVAPSVYGGGQISFGPDGTSITIDGGMDGENAFGNGSITIGPNGETDFTANGGYGGYYAGVENGKWNIPLDQFPVDIPNLTIGNLNLGQLDLANINLADLDLSQLTNQINLNDLGLPLDALSGLGLDPSKLGDLTLGDLRPEQLAQLTLGDIADPNLLASLPLPPNLIPNFDIGNLNLTSLSLDDLGLSQRDLQNIALDTAGISPGMLADLGVAPDADLSKLTLGDIDPAALPLDDLNLAGLGNAIDNLHNAQDLITNIANLNFADVGLGDLSNLAQQLPLLADDLAGDALAAINNITDQFGETMNELAATINPDALAVLGFTPETLADLSPEQLTSLAPATLAKLETLAKTETAVLINQGLVNVADVDLNDVDLTRLDFKQLDLSAVDLSGLDLTGVDLRGVDLSELPLATINLNGVDLSGMDLSQLDLRGADLAGAILTNANLSGLDLTNMDLSGANLQGALLDQANLVGADLTGAILDQADILAEQLAGAIGVGPDFPESVLDPEYENSGNADTGDGDASANEDSGQTSTGDANENGETGPGPDASENETSPSEGSGDDYPAPQRSPDDEIIASMFPPGYVADALIINPTGAKNGAIGLKIAKKADGTWYRTPAPNSRHVYVDYDATDAKSGKQTNIEVQIRPDGLAQVVQVAERSADGKDIKYKETILMNAESEVIPNSWTDGTSKSREKIMQRLQDVRADLNNFKAKSFKPDTVEFIKSQKDGFTLPILGVNRPVHFIPDPEKPGALIGKENNEIRVEFVGGTLQVFKRGASGFEFAFAQDRKGTKIERTNYAIKPTEFAEATGTVKIGNKTYKKFDLKIGKQKIPTTLRKTGTGTWYYAKIDGKRHYYRPAPGPDGKPNGLVEVQIQDRKNNQYSTYYMDKAGNYVAASLGKKDRAGIIAGIMAHETAREAKPNKPFLAPEEYEWLKNQPVVKRTENGTEYFKAKNGYYYNKDKTESLSFTRDGLVKVWRKKSGRWGSHSYEAWHNPGVTISSIAAKQPTAAAKQRYLKNIEEKIKTLLHDRTASNSVSAHSIAPDELPAGLPVPSANAAGKIEFKKRASSSGGYIARAGSTEVLMKTVGRGIRQYWAKEAGGSWKFYGSYTKDGNSLPVKDYSVYKNTKLDLEKLFQEMANNAKASEKEADAQFPSAAAVAHRSTLKTLNLKPIENFSNMRRVEAGGSYRNKKAIPDVYFTKTLNGRIFNVRLLPNGLQSWEAHGPAGIQKWTSDSNGTPLSPADYPGGRADRLRSGELAAAETWRSKFDQKLFATPLEIAAANDIIIEGRNYELNQETGVHKDGDLEIKRLANGLTRRIKGGKTSFFDATGKPVTPADSSEDLAKMTRDALLYRAHEKNTRARNMLISRDMIRQLVQDPAKLSDKFDQLAGGKDWMRPSLTSDGYRFDCKGCNGKQALILMHNGLIQKIEDNKITTYHQECRTENDCKFRKLSASDPGTKSREALQALKPDTVNPRPNDSSMQTLNSPERTDSLKNDEIDRKKMCGAMLGSGDQSACNQAKFNPVKKTCQANPNSKPVVCDVYYIAKINGKHYGIKLQANGIYSSAECLNRSRCDSFATGFLRKTEENAESGLNWGPQKFFDGNFKEVDGSHYDGSNVTRPIGSEFFGKPENNVFDYDLTKPDVMDAPNDKPFKGAKVSKFDSTTAVDPMRLSLGRVPCGKNGQLSCYKNKYGNDTGVILPFPYDDKRKDGNERFNFGDQYWKKEGNKCGSGGSEKWPGICHRSHRGLDIGGPRRERMEKPVPAVSTGEVVVVSREDAGSYGKGVVTYNGTVKDKFGKTRYVYTLNGHADSVPTSMKPGVKIKQGQEIMKMGNSGKSGGPHLHYAMFLLETPPDEVKKRSIQDFASLHKMKGTPVNPRKFNWNRVDKTSLKGN